MPRPFLRASFLAMLAASIVAVHGAAVPSISAATGVPASTVGQLTTVHGVGGFAALLWWRRAQRERPTPRLVAGAVALLAIGALSYAVNPAASRTPTGPLSLAVLAVSVFVVGIAFGLTQVGVSTVAANRGLSAGTLNALHGTYGLGAVSLPLLVAWTDLRTVSLLVAGVAAVAVPWLLRAPDLRGDEPVEPSGDGPARSRRGLRRLWFGDGSRPWVWMFSVAIGVEIGTAAWAPTHMVSRGISEQAASAAIAGYFGVFAVVRFVLAGVVERLDLRRVVVGANLLAAVAAAAAAIVPNPVVAWVLVGVGVGPVFPTTLAWVSRLRRDPEVTRKLMIGGAIGAVVLPGLVGLVAAVVGEGAIPWATAAYGAAAAGLAATLQPVGGRRPVVTGAATPTDP